MNRAKWLTLSTVLIPALLVSASCQSGAKKEREPAGSSEAASNLTWTDAQARKARLSHVEYKIRVKLTAENPMFEGQSEIQFDLKDNSKPLRLDFFEGKVGALKVNGQVVGPEAKAKYWIDLPASALKAGANTVTIDFSQEYSHQGQGLHKFTDPQSKEVFLYSQFETFDANRFMPCFDQPDLRAAFTLTVEAPQKWEVISAARENKITKGEDGHRVWAFPKTPPISTYLFSLHAGPYKVWRDKFEDIPLRIFARPSMAKFVRAKEWFKYTKQGLKYFNAYFGMKYPFKKYDQLLVPEFNAGAMENVGAVTFNERFLWRSQPTRGDLRGLAGTVLHEMAHMWFGDIVTMKWWNDLWLNESFATFMATMAMSEGTEFKEAWQDFFINEKSWGYWEDSLVTTHPIESTVNSVKDSFANFDGITYGKGGAVLKQLRAFMTPEAFQKGIQGYIKTYAFKNAELKEFIGSLQAETPRDLTQWSERWLRQSGTDKVAGKWNCADDNLAQLELIVTPSKGASFRPQTVQTAIFQEQNGRLTGAQSMRVDLLKSNQIIKGPWPCPAFVYPNFGDEGYITVSLDQRSLEFTKKNLSSIADPLLRAMLWGDLWKMVRNTEMPLRDYVQVLNTHMSKENDPLILGQIVQTISGRGGNEHATVLNYWPANDQSSREERQTFITKMEDEFLRRFNHAKTGGDEQRLWFDNYMALVRSPKGLTKLSAWATKNPKNLASGMPFDLDRKWAVVRRLARYDLPVPDKFLAELKKADPSDRGLRQLMAVEAIKPDVKIKEKWVGILKAAKPTVTFAEARTVLRSLFPIEQIELARRFEDDFYSYLNQNARSEDEIFVSSVARSMAPLSCTIDDSNRMREFLKGAERFSASVRKTLKVDLDEDERCQRIRAMSSL